MAIDPALIRTDAQTQALLKQFFPVTANGRHLVRYGLASAGAYTSELMNFEESGSLALAFSAEEEAFITQVFERLAQQIAITPERSTQPAEPFQLASVSRIMLAPDAGGMAHSSLWWEGDYDPRDYIVLELDLDDDPSGSVYSYEQSLIVHEIGHALGLEHPGGRPNDPAYNDRDTIMSYNVGGREDATWFSDSDLQVLREIWGSADAVGSSAGSPSTVMSSEFRIDTLISGGWLVEGFDPAAGDVLELSTSLLSRGSTKLQAVNPRWGLWWAKRSKHELVFDDRTNSLYLNANGRTAGWGANGGLLAVFESGVFLSSADLQLV